MIDDILVLCKEFEIGLNFFYQFIAKSVSTTGSKRITAGWNYPTFS